MRFKAGDEVYVVYFDVHDVFHKLWKFLVVRDAGDYWDGRMVTCHHMDRHGIMAPYHVGIDRMEKFTYES